MTEQIQTLQARLAQVEGQLAANEARFQSIVERNVDGILIVDYKGSILFVNPAAERILCRSSAELVGAELGFPVLAGETVEVDLLCPGGQPTTAEMHVGNTTWSVPDDIEEQPAFLISLRDTTERKQSEAQIRFQSQLLDSVGQAVIATDLGGRIIYWNQAAETLYGWSAEQVFDQHVLEVTPALQSREQAAEVMDILQKGERWSGELLARHRDGHTFPILVTDSPIYDDQRNLVGIVGVSTNIAERKQAETILRIQRDLSLALASTDDLEKAASLVLNIILGMNDIDCGGLYLVEPSSGALNLLAQQGLSPAFVEQASHYAPNSPHALMAQAGKPIYNTYAKLRPISDPIREREGLRAMAFVPISDQHKVIAVFNLASHTQNRFSEDMIHTIEAAAAVVGQTISRIGAEAALREKSEELEQFFNCALDLLCIADTDGFFRRLNREWENVLGYPLEELEGRQFLDLVHPDDVTATQQAVSELDTQKPVLSFTNRYRCRDGSYRWIEWRSLPVGHKIYAAARDVTERKKTQERIIHLNAVLRAIRNVNQLITHEKNRSRLLRGVCECLIEARGYRSAWIASFDPAGRIDLVTSAATNLSFDHLLERIQEGYIPQCVQLALADTEVVILQEKHVCVDCPENTREECLHKMSIRLGHQDRIYGVLTVSLLDDELDHGPVTIDEEEKDLFREVAGDIAYALHSIELEQQRALAETALRRALEQTWQREQENTALLEGARAVLHHQDFEQAARAVFDICKMQVGATSGYVALLSTDGQENEVLFLDAGELPCTVDPELPMPIRGLRAEAYRTRQAVYENGFFKSAWATLMPRGHVRLDNVLFAPLFLDQVPVGLIGLANKPGGFTDQDARIASAFGEFASLALLNSRTLESLQEREHALEAALAEKETMLAEIHHRVKNNLQVVSGLLDFQAQYVEDPQALDALQSCRQRVYAMSLVHEQLYRSSDLTRIDIEAYVQAMVNDLLTVYRNHLAVDVDIQVDHLYLNVRQAIPCGMLINELVSNALKHAFPSHSNTNGAMIGIFMGATSHGTCTLTVSDNGIGLPPDFRFPSDDTLGMFLIDTLVKQLKGTIAWQNNGGTVCHVEFRPNARE
ncbi:MAG: PAS domain S-box protein [Anaerolineae bacterium]|nr:PAS domain S-box protein [Anaerolineae bacterium]